MRKWGNGGLSALVRENYSYGKNLNLKSSNTLCVKSMKNSPDSICVIKVNTEKMV